MNRASWAVVAAVAVLVVGAGAYLWSDDADEPGRPARPLKDPAKVPAGGDPGQSTGRPPADRSVVGQLCAGGWPRDLAEQFDRLNSECWANRGEWQAVADRLLPRAAALGRSPVALSVIRKRLHLTHLLAWAKDATVLAQVLDKLPDGSPNDQLTVAADLFLRYPDRDDAGLLSVALGANADEVLGLARKGFFAPELLFMFPRDTPVARDYAGWLTDLVRRDLLPGNEATDGQKALYAFLTRQGHDLRRRMADDAKFFDRFRDHLWPQFRRLAEPDKPGEPALWDVYAAIPGLWKVLDRDGGEAWVEKYYQLPAQLLECGEYPEEFHPLIRDALTRDEVELLLLLEACCGKEEVKGGLLDLLRRRPRLEAATFRGILVGLLLTGPAVPEPPPADAPDDAVKAWREQATAAQADAANLRRVKLDWIRKTTDEVILKKEFVPDQSVLARLASFVPGFGIVSLAGKVITGRDVDAMDVFDAGLDVIQGARYLLPAAKAAAAAKTGKLVGRSAARLGKGQLTDQARKQVAQRMSADVNSAVVKGAALSAALASPAARAGGGTRALLKVVSSTAGVAAGSFRRLLDWEVQFVLATGGRTLVSVGLVGGKDLAGSLLGALSRQAVAALTETPATDRDAELAHRRNTHAWWTAHLLDR